MKYRKLTKNGPDISLLGYGCMRFPSKNGSINKELAFSQMKLAFDNGVNYFDTAYPYHGGRSEVVLGEFIQKYDIRDKVYIADKLPAFLVNKSSQIEKFFNTQLSRLSTDYIDFYLMHMLDSFKSWEKLKSLGILEFIDEKKKSGEIKYIGFSFHGKHEEFVKILEDYDWDFCQIQYNYLDVNYQAGKAGLKKAYELGIGVIIMEPLRGGSLAINAPDRVKDLFSSQSPINSPAYWSLRWIMNHKEVSVVLSGMNVNEHILDNVDVASNTDIGCMTNGELDVVIEAKSIFDELMKVNCTGCNYCMPCPFGVDIPATFSEYNSKYFFGGGFMNRFMYIGRASGFMGEKKSGGNSCTGCGKCIKHCPQNIDIPTQLREAHKDLDIPVIRGALTMASKLKSK